MLPLIHSRISAEVAVGQTRSTLRQAGFDHPQGPPSRVVAAFEHANHHSGLRAGGSLVLAHLRPAPTTGVTDTGPGAGGWTMRWTNAGHPAPILLLPDGTTQLLDEHGMVFGHALLGHPRHDHHQDLPPGSALLFYTDGLIERRGSDEDTVIAALRDHLTGHRAEPMVKIVDGIMATFGAASRDDIAVLGVRIRA